MPLIFANYKTNSQPVTVLNSSVLNIFWFIITLYFKLINDLFLKIYLSIRFVLPFRRNFYIGSANLGNRGTTKTKEVGVLVRDCPALGDDAGKIFDIYWSVYGLRSLPKQ